MIKFRLHLSQFVIIIISVVLLLVSFLIGKLDIEKQQTNKRLKVLSELTTIGNRLEGVIRSTFNLTQGMVHLIRYQGNISQAQFEALCNMAMSENPHIRNVALAPNNVVRMIYPLKGNEKALGLDYLKNEQQKNSVIRAMELKQPLLAGPVNLVQGGVGLINRSPVCINCESDSNINYWGMASIVAHYDSILKEAGVFSAKGLKLALQGDDGKGIDGRVFFGDSALLAQNPVIVDVVIPGGKWRLIAIPENGWGSKSIYHSQYFIFCLIFSLLIVSFLTTLIYKNHRIYQNIHLLALEINERKKIEVELKKSKEAAEEANRVKTAFLANMSHEIRTPMNAIQGFTEVLLKGTMNSKSSLEYIEIINSSSKQLLNVINDIIDVSMIEAGQLKIINETISLNNVLTNIYSLHSNSASIKNIKLIVKYGLPNTVDLIITDEHRLTQVINNLISNAIKFTNDGYVEFGYFIEDNTIKFYVRDTGIGIPKEYHDIVFERFRQVDDKLSRNYGGTGLGLSICRSIIEMMNGRIWIESDANAGSTFFFTLPYINTPQVSESQNHHHDGVIKLNNRTILIAEDDNFNYLLLEKLLEKTEANIIRANNGQEAVEIFDKDGVDLILMDIKMPIMNGYEAIKIIRNKNSSIPIIAQTAYAMTDEKQIAIDAGCDFYLTKPINHLELFEIFHNIFPK